MAHLLTEWISYRQNELKEGAQRSVGKQYYYIDYEYFCNVVKWRIAKMRHIIDSTLRNVSFDGDSGG
jgi:transcription initiation factor TFIIE subunit alpha